MLVHSEEKPFSCTVCERAFNVVSNLRRHMRTVHKEVEGPLQLKFDQLHKEVVEISPLRMTIDQI